MLLAYISPILHSLSHVFLTPTFSLYIKRQNCCHVVKGNFGLDLPIVLQRAHYGLFGRSQPAILSLCET